MKKLIVVALSCVVASSVMAKDAAFQLSLTPDIALQDRDANITGVSLGVWNENPSPTFNWQFGFVNGATGDSVGLQWFIFLPTIFNYAENYTGAQMGWVNYASGDMKGLQWGWIGNYAGNLTGVQLGTVNIAQGVEAGFQWGLVNYAATANNLFQLGLVNIIADNAWFKDFPGDLAQGMIIVNWSFGGE
ncbi:hypothetical protein PDESU_05785 [Pontiella desulfatans]|uniref:Uncharacterized protein n=1 Tax=Pontiella desulfatans TaxID=2750659 RepID=A0A6C2UAU5_PONDE|nr:hypothetical protein [Pontiella desulfatans]VGO17190.1 hypothetical protein PDESU_05785 [Pontiella desulfatans]